MNIVSICFSRKGAGTTKKIETKTLYIFHRRDIAEISLLCFFKQFMLVNTGPFFGHIIALKA